MLASSLLVLAFIGGKVESLETPELVYDQSIYEHLFEKSREGYGKYNKNSPPMRKDEMTRYNDGMPEFNNTIDKFVDHHCEPYINFLESKLYSSFNIFDGYDRRKDDFPRGPAEESGRRRKWTS